MASAISGLHGGVVGDNSTVIALEQMDQYSKLVKLCLRFGRQLDGRCGRVSDWLDEHRAGVLGMAGIFAALLVLWPLTLDYRKRSRRRRLKGLHCLDNASRRESHAMGETLPLVGNDKSVCYGTSDKS